jgi:hypothetical protein
MQRHERRAFTISTTSSPSPSHFTGTPLEAASPSVAVAATDASVGPTAGANVSGTTATLSGTASARGGYWLVPRDGDIFAFGDATFHDSLPGLPAPEQPGLPVVAMAPAG